MPADSELLRLYADTRSEAAFAQLVHRHLNTVYAAACRRLGGDTHHAADVAQEVFTSLARHAASLARRPVLTGWLHTATRHAAIDIIRREQRRSAREQQALALADVNLPPTPSTDWDQLRPILDATIDQLGERDRELVLLRFFENRSFADIGTQLALSEDAARMRATRALEKLRILLARRGVSSTAAALTLAFSTQPLVAAPVGLAAAITGGAVATAASATALTTVGFLLMTHAKTLLVSAGIMTAVALGTAAYEFHRADKTAVDFARLQQTQDTLQAANASLSVKLATANTSLAELAARQKEAANKSAPPAVAPALPRAKSQWASTDYCRLFVAKQRAALRPRFGQLYRDLHLTPEQISKFEDIQTECQQSVVDVMSAAEAQGLSSSDASVTRLSSEPYNLRESDLRALLGKTDYEQYQKYEKGRDVREFTSSLAADLYASEAPLTATQGNELAKIIAANTETKMIRLRDDGNDPKFWASKKTNWEAVATQAQGLLSDTQISALKQFGEQKRIDGEFTSFLMTSTK